MLSAVDLLELAERLASQIPSEPAYQQQREISWERVGKAWLKVQLPERAVNALAQLPMGYSNAELRFELAKFAAEHPEAQVALATLYETIGLVGDLEGWLFRKPMCELAKFAFGIGGPAPVRDILNRIQDPFTRTTILVSLAGLLSGLEKREVLGEAEREALTVRAGDRDYASRWVL